MIVSHRHKFIFLKTKKTAGTSLEIALRKFIGDEDIATPISAPDEELCQSLGFPGAQNFNVKEDGRAVRLFNHANATLVKKVIGSEAWESYFKFSIVRNPFDCLVSNYYWGIRNKKNKPSFRDWVLKNPGVLVENNKIMNTEVGNAIDFVVQYEFLQDHLLAVEERLPALAGLYEIFSNINAKGAVRPKSSKASTRELFSKNPDVAQLVYLLCESDIEKYQYCPC